MKYDKLVRDKIPEIIMESQRKCSYRQLSDEEFLKYVEKKLDEELQEYHQDKSIEELADLLEVIKAIAEAKGTRWEELIRLMTDKKEQRGGFSKKYLLESAEDAE